MSRRPVEQFTFWTNSGDTRLDLGGERLNLHAAARAALNLADVVERVRERHLALAGKRADAALRRRYRLDR